MLTERRAASEGHRGRPAPTAPRTGTAHVPRQPGACPGRISPPFPSRGRHRAGRVRFRDRPHPAHNRRGRRNPAPPRRCRRPRQAPPAMDADQRDDPGAGIRRAAARRIRLAREPAPTALPAPL